MTARSRSAVRIGAGSVAAALVMCTVALVGPANAALPADGVDIRPVPTQNPTDDNGFQDAPFITTSANAAKVNDFQVSIPSQWNSGDQIKVTLPAGVTYAALPTVAVEGPTTVESQLTNSQTQPVGSQNRLRAPAIRTQLNANTGADVDNGGTLTITFTNDSSTPPAGEDPRFVLKATGVTVNTSVAAQQGALVATVSGANRTGTDPAAPAPFADVTTTLAYVTNVTVGVDQTRPVTPNAGEQTIGAITFSETAAEAFVDGDYQISFTQGPDDAPVPVELGDPDPDGSDFDARVTGDAVLEDGTADAAGGVLTLPLTGLNADGPLETFTLSNIRVIPTIAGPINVTLTAVPDDSNTVLVFEAVQAGPNTSDDDNDDATDFSRVPDGRGGVEATSAIGVVPNGQRFGGNDRYETAATIARQLAGANAVGAVNDNPNGLNTFIIASGEPASGGADALAANYLAGGLDDRNGGDQPVPVLLTRQGRLPDATAVALRRFATALQAQDQTTPSGVTVYVVGGRNAVSDQVVLDIEANLLGRGSVQRIAGNDRYATAAGVSTFLGPNAVGSFQSRFGSGTRKTVFLANGLTSADALSAGPLSYTDNFPVLLTPAARIPQSTLTAMESVNTGNVIVLGGPDVVSAAAVNQLTSLGYTVRRIAGDDRYATNTALQAFATQTVGGTAVAPEGGLGNDAPTSPLLANGLGFADALTAGPLAAVGFVNNDMDTLVADQPLLLTSPARLSAPTAQYLSDNSDSITLVNGIGLSGALPLAVLVAANSAAAQ